MNLQQVYAPGNELNKRSGVTIIELLVTVVLMTSISLLATSFFSRFFAENAAMNLSDQIIMSTRKAQIYSMMSKENSTWGINYSTTTKKFYMFKGASFAGRSVAFDETFDVPTSIGLSGSKEIIFSEVYGLPSTTTIITISKNNTSSTITINSQGVASLK